MNYSTKAMMTSLIFLGSLIVHGCSTVPSYTPPKGHEHRNFEPTKTPDGEMKPARGGQLNEILKEYDHLDRHFRLMDQQGVDADLKRSLKQLQQDPEIVEDVMALYKQLTTKSKAEKEFYGEARWRALHLLGELRNPRAKDFLFKIALTPMPVPEEVGEVNYKVEYRLRARAIVGLEKLKETKLLTQIYNENNLFRGLAAASLYELGYTPPGVTKIDGIKALGYGDPKNYNPRKGSIRDKTPSNPLDAPTSSDDEPGISPTWSKDD